MSAVLAAEGLSNEITADLGLSSSWRSILSILGFMKQMERSIFAHLPSAETDAQRKSVYEKR